MALSTIIKTITNTRTGASYTFTGRVPCELTYGRYDVSMSTAGRDEAGYMHKEMIGTSNKYELRFWGLDTATVKAICQIMETSEYVEITILDPVDGVAPNYLVTRTYYVGDRSMKLYSGALDIWEELSFDIIERGVH